MIFFYNLNKLPDYETTNFHPNVFVWTKVLVLMWFCCNNKEIGASYRTQLSWFWQSEGVGLCWVKVIFKDLDNDRTKLEKTL